jgi:hypothetical protein
LAGGAEATASAADGDSFQRTPAFQAGLSAAAIDFQQCRLNDSQLEDVFYNNAKRFMGM